MSEQDPLPLINGADRYLIDKVVKNGITGFYDGFRMLSFWRRLLAGDNDPEEIAQGLVLALSNGRYIPKPDPVRCMAVTVNISGAADPVALAGAIKDALPEPMPAG